MEETHYWALFSSHLQNYLNRAWFWRGAMRIKPWKAQLGCCRWFRSWETGSHPSSHPFSEETDTAGFLLRKKNTVWHSTLERFPALGLDDLGLPFYIYYCRYRTNLSLLGIFGQNYSFTYFLMEKASLFSIIIIIIIIPLFCGKMLVPVNPAKAVSVVWNFCSKWSHFLPYRFEDL